MSNQSVNTKELPVMVSPQMIVQQLAEQFDMNELKLPSSTDELWGIVINSEVRATLEHIKAGFAYKALKESLPHGDFEKGLKERGIKSRNARNKIAVAQLFCEKEANRQALADFTFAGLIELTRLPEQKIQSLGEDELKELSQLPSRVLASRVKEINDQYRKRDKLERDHERQTRIIQKQDQHIADLTNKVHQLETQQKPETLQESPLISELKARSPQLTEQIEQAAIDLNQLCSAVLMPSHPSEEAFLAAETLYHFLTGPHQRLALIIKRLEDTFGEQLTGERALTIHYEEEQWQEANDLREYVISEHQKRFNPHLSHTPTTLKGR